MIKMPWRAHNCPNVMLEVTDACNITCRMCYKKKGSIIKSIPQIQRDIETAMKVRRLHTITITGGEPTLHPELCRIVAMIKRHRLHVFLLTNGVLIDEDYLSKLRKSGLDSILFHVDMGQIRPDLPANPSFNDIQVRLKQLTEMANSHRLDVSISLTLYDDDQETLSNFSQFFFDLEEITFLFIARGIDPKDLLPQLASSERINVAIPAASGVTYGMQRVTDYYRVKYGIEPFAFLPASDGRRTVWISYFVPIIYSDTNINLFNIRANYLDSWLMEIPRIFSGHYIHKTKQNSTVTLLRVVANGLTTLRLRQLVQFLIQSLSANNKLRHKVIVYDDGPIVENGTFIACEDCPTAIVRDDKVLRCCTADYICQYRRYMPC